jgi:hypothetical protein
MLEHQEAAVVTDLSVLCCFIAVKAVSPIYGRESASPQSTIE